MLKAAVAFVIIVVGMADALAQPRAQAPAAPPPATSAPAPQRTTASYEDWTVRCESRGTPAVKSCEMVQAVTAPGQASPVT
jgi:invasion protein IalB